MESEKPKLDVDLRSYLLKLPVEIFEMIARQINNPQTLSSLCRTCRQLNFLVQPMLYETIKIDVDQNFGINSALSKTLVIHQHSGLVHVKNFIISGDFNFEASIGPIELSLLRKIGDNQNEMIFLILQNIPPNTLRTFAWLTNVEMNPDILKLILKEQNLLEGYWNIWGYFSGYETLGVHPESLSLGKGRLKHFHALGFSNLSFLKAAYWTILHSRANIETLSLGFNLALYGLLNASLSSLNEKDQAIPCNYDPDAYHLSILSAFLADSTNLEHTKNLENISNSDTIIFPSLRYLSLRHFDQGKAELASWFKRAIDTTKLTVLKLKYCKRSYLIGTLQSGGCNLKILHLISTGYETQTRNLLKSFSGLEELILDHDCEDLDNMATAIGNHKKSLKILCWFPHSKTTQTVLATNSQILMHEVCANLVELAVPVSWAFLCANQAQLEVIWLLGSLGNRAHDRVRHTKFVKQVFELSPRLQVVLVGQGITYPPFSMRTTTRTALKGEMTEVRFSKLQKDYPDYRILQYDKPFIPGR